MRSFSAHPRHTSFPSQWNASFSMPITRRWFDTISDVSQRNLTLEPTAVLEYVIPGDWLGGADAARMAGQSGHRLRRRGGAKLVEFIAAAYTQWRAGLVFKTGWRF